MNNNELLMIQARRKCDETESLDDEDEDDISNRKTVSQSKNETEKRRRDQENVFIEELAELIFSRLSDMNSFSVKPDKCAILDETVKQIQILKSEKKQSDLQGSEVSSSKPTIIASQVFGPLLLKCLDGFLFVINQEFKFEFVSENIREFLNYTPNELQSKSINTIVHIGDQNKFAQSLTLPSVNWPRLSTDGSDGALVNRDSDSTEKTKSRRFNCRFLVKDDKTKEGYECMQISCVLMPFPKTGGEIISESETCLLCVARRINNRMSGGGVGSSGSLPLTLNPVMASTSTTTGCEQFSTRVDLSGHITAIDTSSISQKYAHFLNKNLVGKRIMEICHPADSIKIQNHLKEVIARSISICSEFYRLQISQNKFVQVQTKSRKFNHAAEEAIVSTHSILKEEENSDDAHLVLVRDEKMEEPKLEIDKQNFNEILSPENIGNDFSLNDCLGLSEMFSTTSNVWSDYDAEQTTPTTASASGSSTTTTTTCSLMSGTDQGGGNTERLRNLLTHRNDAGSSNDILRDLLNQDEDDSFSGFNHSSQNVNYSNPTPSTSSFDINNEKSQNSNSSASSSSAGNNMLRKLLNDEDPNKGYRKRPEEDILIQQLLKKDPLKEALGKRKSVDDQYDHASKRISSSTSVNVNPAGGVNSPASGGNGSVSSTNSQQIPQQLAGQNPMLASMLAQTPKTLPAAPISIPTSIVSQVPQERLPKNLEKKLIHTPANQIGLIQNSTVPNACTTTINAAGSAATVVVSSHIVTSPTNGGIVSISNVIPQSSNQLFLATGTQLQPIRPNQQQQQQQQQQRFQLKQVRQVSSLPHSASPHNIISPSVRPPTPTNIFFQQHPAPRQLPPQTVGNQIQPEQASFLDQIVSTTTTPSAGRGTPTQLLEHQSDPLLSVILEDVWSMEEEKEKKQDITTTSGSPPTLNSVGTPLLNSMPVASPSVAPRSSPSVATSVNHNAVNSTEDDTMLFQILDDLAPTPPNIAIPASLSGNSVASSSTSPNDKLAISAIQRELMSCEAVTRQQQQPLYPQQNFQGFTSPVGPPPAYPSAGPQQPILVPQQGLGQRRLGGPTQIIQHRPQFTSAPPSPAAQSVSPSVGSSAPNLSPVGLGLLHQQPPLSIISGPQVRLKMVERRPMVSPNLQQQQKRLLAQQQHQQLTMQTPQDPAIFAENMNEILNNTIAPNVALQIKPRVSSSVTPTTEQLSPRYNLVNSQHSPLSSSQPPQLSPGGQRVGQISSSVTSTAGGNGGGPYSPLQQQQPSQSFPSPSPGVVGAQNSFVPGNSSRMSPCYTNVSSPIHAPNSPAAHHLQQQPSPRSTSSPLGVWQTPAPPPPPPPVSTSSSPSPGSSPVSVRTQQSNRIQQQNPMLNAQLSTNGFHLSSSSSSASSSSISSASSNTVVSSITSCSPSPASSTVSTPSSLSVRFNQRPLPTQQQHQIIQNRVLNSPSLPPSSPFSQNVYQQQQSPAPATPSSTAVIQQQPQRVMTPQQVRQLGSSVSGVGGNSNSGGGGGGGNSGSGAGGGGLNNSRVNSPRLALETNNFSMFQQDNSNQSQQFNFDPRSAPVSGDHVRQELRAILGARNQQQQQQQQQQNQSQSQPPPSSSSSQQPHQNRSVNSPLTLADLDAVGLSLELSESAGFNNSSCDSQLFTSLFPDLGRSNLLDQRMVPDTDANFNNNTTNSTTSGSQQSQHLNNNSNSTRNVEREKKSLLQQLLSEPP